MGYKRVKYVPDTGFITNKRSNKWSFLWKKENIHHNHTIVGHIYILTGWGMFDYWRVYSHSYWVCAHGCWFYKSPNVCWCLPPSIACIDGHVNIFWFYLHSYGLTNGHISRGHTLWESNIASWWIFQHI